MLMCVFYQRLCVLFLLVYVFVVEMLEICKKKKKSNIEQSEAVRYTGERKMGFFIY